MYSPAALPRATSALAAALNAPLFNAASLILASSVMCFSKVTEYFFWFSSRNSPMYLATKGYLLGLVSSEP